VEYDNARMSITGHMGLIFFLILIRFYIVNLQDIF